MCKNDYVHKKCCGFFELICQFMIKLFAMRFKALYNIMTKQNSHPIGGSSFWLGCRDFALDFCSTSRICFNEMFRKNLRSPFKNSALCCFLTAFESHYIPTNQKNKCTLLRGCISFFGWGAGIRTPVMSESESDALPLGDTPIFSTLTL